MNSLAGTCLIFTSDADGVSRCSTETTARFRIVIERYGREKFQKEGHFVPRMVDEHGMPRDWDGPLVFVGLLNYELKDADGTLQSKLQVLRVLADTPTELFRLMDLRIVETFFGMFWAQQVRTAQGDDVKRVSEENTRLKARVLELLAALGVEGVKA
jgi:hypothetical protein